MYMVPSVATVFTYSQIAACCQHCSKKLKHTAAFAGTYVVTEILIVILMGIGVLDLPKHIILPSFEWSGVIVILFFLYYFGDYVGKENIEC